MPIIGAHVSAAVSIDLSFDKALNIGAKATQIYISPYGFATNKSFETVETEKR